MDKYFQPVKNSDQSDFLGLGKEAKRRKRARTDLIQAQADATRILANKGIGFQFRGAASSGIGNALSGVAKMVTGGGSPGTPTEEPTYNARESATATQPDTLQLLAAISANKKPDNTMMYVAIGGGLLLILLLNK